MKRFEAPSTLTLAVAVLAGAITLAGLGWGLSAAARPKDYAERMTAVDAALAEIERTSGAAQAANYGEGVLCRGPALSAANALRGRLVQQSAQTGLTVKTVSAAPSAAGGASKLAAIDVVYVAEGSYEGARRMIAALGAGQPEVFIDSLEFRPSAGATRLKISGRAFCWISARR